MSFSPKFFKRPFGFAPPVQRCGQAGLSFKALLDQVNTTIVTIEDRHSNKAAMTKRLSIFIVGVQKGGTTSLHNYLCAHPELSNPSRKELHFFDDETRDWIDLDYTELDVHFDPSDGDRRRFDTTPVYSFWPSSIPRIAGYNPQARMILLVRDPLERAWSHWSMEFGRNTESLPFAAAIREGRERLDRDRPHDQAWRLYSYLERGLYAGQLQRLYDHFPRSQVFLLKSEDLRDRPTWSLGQISEFLHIGPFGPVEPRRDMMRPSGLLAPAPSPEDKVLSRRFFALDLIEFQRLSDLDLNSWPTFADVIASR